MADTKALKVAQATAKVMREMAERKNETILKLEAKLAERDAQLVAVMELLEQAKAFIKPHSLVLHANNLPYLLHERICAALATRQPTQDKGE